MKDKLVIIWNSIIQITTTLWHKIKCFFKSKTFRNNKALLTGIAMGVAAAIVQGCFDIQPPVGVGVCAISHPANLLNYIINNILGTDFVIHSIFLEVPILTSIGFIVGSFIAAITHHEFKFKYGPVRDNVLAFIFGFLVIVFGLLWGSCPIRTVILGSYGMVFAYIVFAAIVLGVICACEYIKWRVRK